MDTIWNFVRSTLGMKNLADYAQSRQKMLGLTNLSVRTVLDIGANKGRHTRMYRRKFPDATIYAVEPIPYLADKIQEWGKTQSSKVQVLNLALANETGDTEFFINRRSSIWSTLRVPENNSRSDYEQIIVQVETLDNLAGRFDWENDIIVKIDTEGLDLEVIRGGKETLQRAAAIIVETMYFPTDYGEDAPVFEEVVSELWDLGYAYRGSIRCGWNQGVCYGADALFVRREVAHRLVA